MPLTPLYQHKNAVNSAIFPVKLLTHLYRKKSAVNAAIFPVKRRQRLCIDKKRR